MIYACRQIEMYEIEMLITRWKFQHETRLMPGMMCLGISREENPVTPCLAVPGAPLVISGHLAGLLSWGFGCGYQNDLPLVYTDMRYYQPYVLCISSMKITTYAESTVLTLTTHLADPA